MEVKEETKLRPGQLLCVSEGKYSAYHVVGFFVVISEFDWRSELANHLEEFPDQAKDYQFDTYSFLNRLTKLGLLLEISYKELWLGEFGEWGSVSLYDRR